MKQQLNFSNQTALVMGAGRGIGLATARKLAEYGATVILAARTEKDIISGAKAIVNDGGSAHSIVCDVSKYTSVEAAIAYSVSLTGKLDYLINNAGVIEPLALLANSDPEEWSRAADINYKGVYYGMRAAIPHMLQQGSGVIVNMSSGAANSALPGWSHYCSNKAATQKLTEVGHKEVTTHGVRIVGLSPGTVATDFMGKIRESKINAVSNLDWSAHIPPEWAAEGVAFLCGPGGAEFAGTDFSIKTPEGRSRVGLPIENAPDQDQS